jgi:hypothetical protein
MFNSLRRVSVVVVLAVFSLITAADAQKASQAPTAPKQQSNFQPGSASDGSDGYGAGWNYAHATNCKMYDYAGNTYLVLYPWEGGDFWTLWAPYQNLIMAACQSGNWLAFHVVDGSGVWDSVYTYDYY